MRRRGLRQESHHRPRFTWRCSSAAFLTAAAEQIDALDVAAVRREFSVAEMDDLHLYKVQAEDDDEKAFARVLAHVRNLAEHYRATARLGLDMIITKF